MKWQDVTRPLGEGMLVFSGDMEPVFHQEKHGLYLISELHLSSHTGTHIDAPTHYLKTGHLAAARIRGTQGQAKKKPGISPASTKVRKQCAR